MIAIPFTYSSSIRWRKSYTIIRRFYGTIPQVHWKFQVLLCGHVYSLYCIVCQAKHT